MASGPYVNAFNDYPSADDLESCEFPVRLFLPLNLLLLTFDTIFVLKRVSSSARLWRQSRGADRVIIWCPHFHKLDR